MFPEERTMHLLVFLFLPFAFGYDIYSSVNICATTESDVTEYELLTKALACTSETTGVADSGLCRTTSDCLAHVIVNLTLSLPCDHPDTEAQEHDEPQILSECKPATVAFFLVETLRKYLSAAVTDKPSQTCPLRKQLRDLISVCAPEQSNQGALAGYDLLARLISKKVGALEPIASEMGSVQRKRLWQGAMVVAFTFAVPGLLTVVSPQHIQMVCSLQALSACVIFFYVNTKNGFLYALGAVSLCALVFVVQLLLIVIVHRNSASQLHERTE